METKTEALQVRRLMSHVLFNFPALWRQVQGNRDDLEQGYRQGATVGGGRSSGHSDSTGSRASALADLAEVERLLGAVRCWIDYQLTERWQWELLIEVWRCKGWGWKWTGRQLKKSPRECAEQWSQLVEWLSKSHYVLHACGPDLTAFVRGHAKNLQVQELL